MAERCMDSALLARLIKGGADNLSLHVDEVNDLNVFPIPDGDTGNNMLLTVRGGTLEPRENESIGEFSRRAADGMLLSARGNSGVILSQLFDGIADGLGNLDEADANDTAKAFNVGVEHAYSAVVEPVEGTILTVAREASEHAAGDTDSLDVFLESFLTKARETLKKTPELLDVLKKAGVVDSGGAGLIYIIEGMAEALAGRNISGAAGIGDVSGNHGGELDLDLFNEDSELEFGYCTELLLRLQRSKTDVENFDVNEIKDFLGTIGDSTVCFKNGSIVKIHVHTMTPWKVLEFCQRYGEYLTVKVENMTLQHSNTHREEPAAARKTSEAQRERKEFGIVAVASGEGIKQTFLDMGTDVIIDGGQSMNPSADDFLEAFEKANAKTVFALPNNSNVILAARQAAKLCKDSDVRVIETRSVGDCYAVLTMYNTDSGDTDEIVSELTGAMEGVTTAYVSKCVRDTELDGFELHEGDFIGFEDKAIKSAAKDRLDAAKGLISNIDFEDREICIIVRGADTTENEALLIEKHVREVNRGTEVYMIDGGQDIYSYIFIIE